MRKFARIAAVGLVLAFSSLSAHADLVAFDMKSAIADDQVMVDLSVDAAPVNGAAVSSASLSGYFTFDFSANGLSSFLSLIMIGNHFSGHWTGDTQASSVSVPEPGTLALFGLGLAGIGFARRRRAA